MAPVGGKGTSAGGRTWAAAAGLAVEDGTKAKVKVIWPRFVATLLLGFLLVTLSATLFNWWAAGPLQLQPLIVIIVSAGFHLPLIPGAVITFLLAYMYDLVSGGPLGMQMTAYMVVFCLCKLAERKLEINSWPFQMAAVCVLSVIRQFLVLIGVALVQGLDPAVLKTLWAIPGHAILAALTAPIFFGLLDWLIKLISKLSPAARRRRHK